MSKLFLEIPSIEEMEYRQYLLSDPKTMSYNKGYDICIKGYNKKTGCIDFPKEQWEDWFNIWIGNQPVRYYAHIIRKEDGIPIGNVNIHYNKKSNIHDMGIVIESKFRGLGYSLEALELLVTYAFEECEIEVLHNDFEYYRDVARSIHETVGFKLKNVKDGICHFQIRKKEYFDKKVLL